MPANQEVVVVSAGNSAGQGIVAPCFPRGQGLGAGAWRRPRRDHVALSGRAGRRGWPMWKYSRIPRSPRWKAPRGMLSAVHWHRAATGETVRRPIRHLFLFIGADPNTAWLSGSGRKSSTRRVFVLTGAGSRRKSALAGNQPARSPTPSAISGPARSSALPPRSAKARRSWRRCTPICCRQPRLSGCDRLQRGGFPQGGAPT